jgi:hypothetical protein
MFMMNKSLLVVTSAIVFGVVNIDGSEQKKARTEPLLCSVTNALDQLNASSLQSTIAKAGPVQCALVGAGIGFVGGWAIDKAKELVPAKIVLPAVGVAAGVGLYYNQGAIPAWYQEAKLALQIAKQFTQQERELLAQAMKTQTTHSTPLITISSYGRDVLQQFQPAPKRD